MENMPHIDEVSGEENISLLKSMISSENVCYNVNM